MDKKDMKKYESSYNEDDLFAKISKFASKAGVNVIYYVFLLYNLVAKQFNPVAIAALGYFISPIDLIPDFIFGTGFVDDASVLLAALASLASQITPEIKNAAKEGMRKWISFKDEDLDEKYR